MSVRQSLLCLPILHVFDRNTYSVIERFGEFDYKKWTYSDIYFLTFSLMSSTGHMYILVHEGYWQRSIQHLIQVFYSHSLNFWVTPHDVLSKRILAYPLWATILITQGIILPFSVSLSYIYIYITQYISVEKNIKGVKRKAKKTHNSEFHCNNHQVSFVLPCIYHFTYFFAHETLWYHSAVFVVYHCKELTNYRNFLHYI